MNEVTTVGIDLAKQVFSVHGVDGRGQVILRRTVRREKLAELVAQLPRCRIGMEACSGAHIAVLDERISEYERELARLTRQNPAAQRVQALPGVGPLTASALVVSVGTAHEFDNGRQFAAWLGLVPRQYSTGGKTRLGHITRRGDPYLRTLLILGARSVLQTAGRHEDRRSRWALSVRERRGYHRACVAIAAKYARIIWALLAKEETLNLAA